MSPDDKLVAVVGDNPDGLLVDANSGKMVHDLHGHLDYSFASAWNPDGRTFATGNQDKTCRIWDTRNLSNFVAVLGGNIGAIRSIRYTADGKFLVMAEPVDFIHVFDVESGYSRKQELDFFGEVAGMALALGKFSNLEDGQKALGLLESRELLDIVHWHGVESFQKRVAPTTGILKYLILFCSSASSYDSDHEAFGKPHKSIRRAVDQGRATARSNIKILAVADKEKDKG